MLPAAGAKLCAWCRQRPASSSYCSTRCRVAAFRERRRYAIERPPALVTVLDGVTGHGAIAGETVAALYVRADGFYAAMPNVDAWPVERDATRYEGPHPVVAHPDCAPWGRYRTIAPTHKRADLAVRAVDQVRWWGGVLEHPAASHLWVARDLPEPGELQDQWGGWSLLIRQSWWGHRAPKPTWLYIVGKSPGELPPLPPPVPDPGGRVELMAQRERELTPPALAAWLVEVARGALPRRRRNPHARAAA